MEKHISNIDELNIQDQHKEKIYLKPKYILKIMLILGILLQLSLEWRLMGLGIFMIIMAILGIKYGADREVVDLYDEHIFIYDANKKENGILIYHGDIEEWRCFGGNQGPDYFVVKTNNNQYRFDTFNSKRVSNYLWKKIPEKEGRSMVFDKLKKSKTQSKWKLWYKNLTK